MLDQEFREIVGALDVLLSAVIVHSPPEPVRWAKQPMTMAVARTHGICDDPIGRSLRMGIRELGMSLHDYGGLQAMRQALNACADLHPETEDRREDILDKAWNGVGDWLA